MDLSFVSPSARFAEVVIQAASVTTMSSHIGHPSMQRMPARYPPFSGRTDYALTNSAQNGKHRRHAQAGHAVSRTLRARRCGRGRSARGIPHHGYAIAALCNSGGPSLAQALALNSTETMLTSGTPPPFDGVVVEGFASARCIRSSPRRVWRRTSPAARLSRSRCACLRCVPWRPRPQHRSLMPHVVSSPVSLCTGTESLEGPAIGEARNRLF